MPFEDAQAFARFWIPDANGFVIAAAGELLAVLRKCQRIDPVGMSLERAHLFAGARVPEPPRQVPQLCCAVHASRCQALAVLAARKVARRLPEQPRGIQLALPAPDNKRLFLAGTSTSYLWDIAADKLIHTLPLPFGRLKSAAFSPDGRMLACGDWDGKLHVWNSLQAAEERVLTGLVGYVHCLVISPDNRLLAAGGWRRISVWELETGQERCTFRDYEGDAFSLAFSPDGRYLASGNGDVSVLIWDVAGEALAASRPAA